MKILLGITGSVATSLTPKLVKKLQANGHEVKIVATDMAFQFLTLEQRFECTKNSKCFVDAHEFYGEENYEHTETYKKDDPVLHIELREWADVFLICPLSANTMGKMVNGICDNLLTSVFRAWDFSKPVYVAPSCNTKMWLHPVTKTHLKTFKEWGINVIYPTVKKLACGEYGVGALPDLDIIVNLVEGYRWENPFRSNASLEFLPDLYIPVSPHPGSFGFPRKICCHSGVDLYADVGTNVFPFEDGEVIDLGQFTGKKVGCDWWNDTWFVTIKGKSGNIVYGEIKVNDNIKIGTMVNKNITLLGTVLRVVKNPPKKIVENHKCSMLHVELLRNSFLECPEWKIGDQNPDGILDPTQYLYMI